MNRLCFCFFFFSSRRRHTRCSRDWSSDVCSSDLCLLVVSKKKPEELLKFIGKKPYNYRLAILDGDASLAGDRKSTRLNSSHGYISYAVFCLKKKKKKKYMYAYVSDICTNKIDSDV